MSWNDATHHRLSSRMTASALHRAVSFLAPFYWSKTTRSCGSFFSGRLHGPGFSVHPAADGAEALRWCEQHQGAIDIVVGDILAAFRGTDRQGPL
jgi:hypothetical protein